MIIHTRKETKARITDTELKEALGLDYGIIQEIKREWNDDFIRSGCGAWVTTIVLVDHDHARRKPRPRRK
jgi:hypothetical protein